LCASVGIIEKCFDSYCYSDQTRKASHLKKGGGCVDLKKREEFLKHKNIKLLNQRKFYGKLSREFAACLTIMNITFDSKICKTTSLWKFVKFFFVSNTQVKQGKGVRFI